MAVAEDHVFLGREALKPHRTTGVDLVGGDPDFCPQTILEPIRKAR